MQKITTCLRSILKLIYKFWKKKKEEEAVRVSVEPHSDFRSKQKLPNKQIFCSDSATLHENHLNIWWDLINQGNPLQSNSCWVMSCILVWQVASNWRSQISYSCTKFISQVIHMPLHESQFWFFFLYIEYADDHPCFHDLQEINQWKIHIWRTTKLITKEITFQINSNHLFSIHPDEIAFKKKKTKKRKNRELTRKHANAKEENGY